MDNFGEKYLNMNYSTYANRLLAHYWHQCILCVFLILLGIFGCGGDEVDTADDEVDTAGDEVDTAAKIVGTWELKTIDGKKPKAYVQQDIEDETAEVLAVENKILFASNGIFRQETLITSRGLILDSPTPVYIRSLLRITTKGRYAISISTVVFIYSNDDSDIKLDLSLDTPGNPKLKQQLEQQAEWKELKAKAKQEAPHDFRLDLNIQTLELEGEILTSTNNGKVVYRKR